MLDTLLKAWGPLEKLTGAVRSPLRAEVVYLAYNDLDRIRSDVVVIIDPWPQRYVAKVEVTNRSGQPTYVTRAFLTLNRAKRYEWRRGKPVKLDPHEVRTEGFVFPVERSDTPLEEADFVIEIIPSVGRRTKVRGRMPVEAEH